VLDDLIARFGADDDHAARARAIYDERRGRIFEDEELWDSWSQSFLEWYVLEWRQGDEGETLAAQALARETDPARAAVIDALMRSHRSLFEVVALREGQVALVDLLGGAAFDVAEDRTLHGVHVGDVLEARLIGLDGAVRFGRTFCFHPTGTRRAIGDIVARLRAAGRARLDIVDDIAALRVRCERYQHVPPVRVYERGVSDEPTADEAAPDRS
jgi:hypothetical protein